MRGVDARPGTWERRICEAQNLDRGGPGRPCGMPGAAGAAARKRRPSCAPRPRARRFGAFTKQADGRSPGAAKAAPKRSTMRSARRSGTGSIPNPFRPRIANGASPAARDAALTIAALDLCRSAGPRPHRSDAAAQPLSRFRAPIPISPPASPMRSMSAISQDWLERPGAADDDIGRSPTPISKPAGRSPPRNGRPDPQLVADATHARRQSRAPPLAGARCRRRPGSTSIPARRCSSIFADNRVADSRRVVVGEPGKETPGSPRRCSVSSPTRPGRCRARSSGARSSRAAGAIWRATTWNSAAGRSSSRRGRTIRSAWSSSTCATITPSTCTIRPPRACSAPTSGTAAMAASA